MSSTNSKISIKISPTYKQSLAWGALLDHTTRYVVFGGAAGGGKSYMACQWLLVQCVNYPGVKYFIAREKLKTLKQSTLLTFFKVAKAHGIEKDVHFKWHQQEGYIEFINGSRIDILELKFNPSDPLFEDLGSLEFTGGFIEEAGEIDIRAFDTIKTRIGRHMNDTYNIFPKIFISCNPKKNWLYTDFYKPWKESRLPEDTQFIQAFVHDNPFQESEYKKQLESIRDPIKRQRLLEGNWEYDTEKGTLMTYDAISDLFSNAIEFSNEKFMTVDVARFGQDRTVLFFWRGWNLYRKEIYNNQGTDITARLVSDFAKSEKIPYSHIVIDQDGVGGGVLDACRGAKGFTNNASPIENYKSSDREYEKQNFANLKTQCTFMMAERVNDHAIGISIDDVEFQESLSQELEVIRRKNVDNDTQRLQLVPKDELKQIIGRSPDLSDAFIMRMYFELRPEYRFVGEEYKERDKEQARVLSQQPFNRMGI